MLNIFNTNTPQQIKKQVDAVKYLSLTQYCLGIEGDDRVPAGAYSVYFRKGTVGIKVVHGSFGPVRVGGSKSLSTLRRSKGWREATKEYNILKQVEMSGVTPIPYAVKAVRIGDKYFSAIFMQHIRGITFDRFFERVMSQSIRRANINKLEKCQRRLKKFGIVNLDAYGSNVIVTAHKGNRILSLKIVDFSPELIQRARD